MSVSVSTTKVYGGGANGVTAVVTPVSRGRSGGVTGYDDGVRVVGLFGLRVGSLAFGLLGGMIAVWVLALVVAVDGALERGEWLGMSCGQKFVPGGGDAFDAVQSYCSVLRYTAVYRLVVSLGLCVLTYVTLHRGRYGGLDERVVSVWVQAGAAVFMDVIFPFVASSVALLTTASGLGSLWLVSVAHGLVVSVQWWVVAQMSRCYRLGDDAFTFMMSAIFITSLVYPMWIGVTALVVNCGLTFFSGGYYSGVRRKDTVKRDGVEESWEKILRSMRLECRDIGVHRASVILVLEAIRDGVTDAEVRRLAHVGDTVLKLSVVMRGLADSVDVGQQTVVLQGALNNATLTRFALVSWPEYSLGLKSRNANTVGTMVEAVVGLWYVMGGNYDALNKFVDVLVEL